MTNNNTPFKVNYGLVFMQEVKYWFMNGRIHSSVGSSIGYEEGPMTEKEAIELAESGHITLGSKPLRNSNEQ